MLMTNIITLYYVPDVHYYHIPYQSLRPSYSCIALYCMTSHTNQSGTNTQELHCVTNQRIHSEHVYHLYTPELDFLVFSFLSAKISFVVSLLAFLIIQKNTSTSITSRFVGQIPITLRFLLWSWSSYDKCSRFHLLVTMMNNFTHNFIHQFMTTFWDHVCTC